jgi:hypothetical protein
LDRSFPTAIVAEHNMATNTTNTFLARAILVAPRLLVDSQQLHLRCAQDFLMVLTWLRLNTRNTRTAMSGLHCTARAALTLFENRNTVAFIVLYNIEYYSKQGTPIF